MKVCAVLCVLVVVALCTERSPVAKRRQKRYGLGALSGLYKDVNDKVDDAKKKVKDKVDDAKKKVEDKVNDAKKKVEDKVNDAKKKVEDKVNDTKKEVEDKVDDATNFFNDTLDETEKVVESTFYDATDFFNDTLGDATSLYNDTVNNHAIQDLKKKSEGAYYAVEEGYSNARKYVNATHQIAMLMGETFDDAVKEACSSIVKIVDFNSIVDKLQPLISKLFAWNTASSMPFSCMCSDLCSATSEALMWKPDPVDSMLCGVLCDKLQVLIKGMIENPDRFFGK